MNNNDLANAYGRFAQDCIHYKEKILSHEHMIYTLRKLADKNSLHIDDVLNAMAKVDKRFFTVRREVLELDFERKMGFPLVKCPKEYKDDFYRMADSLPYAIDAQLAVDERGIDFGNHVFIDMLLFQVLAPHKGERVAEVAVTNGYLSGLTATVAQDVTLFETIPSLYGTAEKNLKDAGIGNSSSVRIGNNLSLLEDYFGAFDKLVISVGVTEQQFAFLQRLLKNNGVAIGVVGDNGKGSIVYSQHRRLEYLAAVDFRRTLTEDWN